MASKGQPAPKKQKTEQSQEPDEEALAKEFSALSDVQEKLEQLSEEASEAIIKLEHQYLEKKAPFYKQRNDVIKRIPNFWKTAVFYAISCPSDERRF
jgi:template-activating factor I